MRFPQRLDRQLHEARRRGESRKAERAQSIKKTWPKRNPLIWDTPLDQADQLET